MFLCSHIFLPLCVLSRHDTGNREWRISPLLYIQYPSHLWSRRHLPSILMSFHSAPPPSACWGGGGNKQVIQAGAHTPVNRCTSRTPRFSVVECHWVSFDLFILSYRLFQMMGMQFSPSQSPARSMPCGLQEKTRHLNLILFSRWCFQAPFLSDQAAVWARCSHVTELILGPLTHTAQAAHSPWAPCWPLHVSDTTFEQPQLQMCVVLAYCLQPFLQWPCLTFINWCIVACVHMRGNTVIELFVASIL